MSTIDHPVAMPLTYEAYMAEGEIHRRYDILDGVRCYMTNPSRMHQRLLLKIAMLMERYERSHKSGNVLIAPCDVLIQKFPLRTRQPDVLFISNERTTMNPPSDDPAPLDPAPELVVEIVSPSASIGVLAGKLTDYQKVDVLECWIVQPEHRTVELLTLTKEQIDSAGIYTEDADFTSRVFPELHCAVSEIFTE